ncbi:MAG: hypothetical protein GY805_02020 [Chloroflexi bacterium]|nr:hypothetical protein [Chloroflexota bacterium]
MPKMSNPGFNLFLDILLKLEELDIPYAIIGGFAATIYGITRTTFDIDIVVNMEESHIQNLSAAFPLPRYYADPHQMQNAIEIGSSFNIIDSTLGEKADLFPLTMDLRYKPAFENRIRQTVDMSGMSTPLSVWAARPEDVILGKLMAWAEGKSERHPADIYEMMLFHYLGGDTDLPFDVQYVSGRAKDISQEAADLWALLDETAQEETKPE